LPVIAFQRRKFLHRNERSLFVGMLPSVHSRTTCKVAERGAMKQFRLLLMPAVLSMLLAVVGVPSLATGEEKEDSATAADKVEADFSALKGRWMRLDGGYILSVKDIDASGKMDAAYYNPRPINVSRAQAMQEAATLRVFIELRDAGYPGSTYTLTYDPKTDRLGGVYYQAAIGQRFDVAFVRSK
jgi:hypothetical protein